MNREKMSPEKRFLEVREEIIDSGYPAELWRLTETFALSYLRKGRIDFDVPHTRAVVSWGHRLVTDYNERVRRGDIIDGGKEIDSTVIITAAWLHDIGYYGEFDDVASPEQVGSKKEKHMIVGAKMASEFLHKEALGMLSKEQIRQIVGLIRVHDDLKKIKTMPETILLEADTLGAMDISWVKPTFKGQQALDYLSRDRTKERHKIFKTPLGRESRKEIVDRFRQFIIERDFNGIDPIGKIG